jgi:hypothetical protein
MEKQRKKNGVSGDCLAASGHGATTLCRFLMENALLMNYSTVNIATVVNLVTDS